MIFKIIVTVLIYKGAATVEIYDFIVVGAGSSGSVIASRLSEVPQWSVLLLEVGDKENFVSQIPITVSFLQFTKYNWRYFMEYQPGVALGCENGRMPWPRGRALGGTSVINYMIYTRGQKQFYDKWGLSGNPGWFYKDVLPYFIKSENVALKNYNAKYHGKGGYLQIEDAYQTPISKGFIEGLHELGVPTIDYNSNVTIGVSRLQATTLNGKKHSVARAFLEPVKDRPNLRILTRAFVTKVLINGKTKEAYGVEYEISGVPYKAIASKEVILSAGAFNSPQLLILAGIGPKDHLKELGIPLLKNLPVGQNLEDHLTYVGLSFKTNQPVTQHFSQINPFNFYKFVVHGTGPFTSLGGAESIAYIRTHESDEPQDVPDIELLFIGASLALDFGISIRTGMGLTDEIYNAVFGPLEGGFSFSIFPMLLNPKSKGYLKLKSKDPHDYPLFYGNFFTDPEHKDMKTFLASIRYIQKLGKTEAFKKFNATFNTNRVPGCEHNKYDSDVYWECCLRFLAQTLHHQVGTARMGPSKDPRAVVSHQLKVHGIGRLRVADCSVIPFEVGAHTNAPAIMVGEKAADLIKADWLRN